ncbi:MAG: hypothetical protein ABIR79_06215 [Candidatus Binatia bacterium]
MTVRVEAHDANLIRQSGLVPGDGDAAVRRSDRVGCHHDLVVSDRFGARDPVVAERRIAHSIGAQSGEHERSVPAASISVADDDETIPALHDDRAPGVERIDVDRHDAAREARIEHTVRATTMADPLGARLPTTTIPPSGSPTAASNTA